MRENLGFLVRPFTRDDSELFYRAVKESVDSLSYWLPWCHSSYSLRDAENWTGYSQEVWEQGTEFPLGIFEVSTGRLVGGTGINHINTAYHIGNIGYWIATPFTGRGIAKIAARMASDIGFTELGLTRLEIAVLTHNKAIQKVAEALGARRESVSRNRLYFEGKPHDAIVYSLVPEDMPDGLKLR
jgi:ribosomal-protein-serine acetyltransferase